MNTVNGFPVEIAVRLFSHDDGSFIQLLLQEKAKRLTINLLYIIIVQNGCQLISKEKEENRSPLSFTLVQLVLPELQLICLPLHLFPFLSDGSVAYQSLLERVFRGLRSLSSRVTHPSYL